MKKKKKIILLSFIILMIFLFSRNIQIDDIFYNLNIFISKITNTSEYKTIKKDINKNYLGIGQEKIKGKDGYFTTFTTIDNNKKTYNEYKQKPINNRWTTSSHYMVLLATDDNDMVYVSNPNGEENNSKSSGWYKFEEITPYIAKALYIENY